MSEYVKLSIASMHFLHIGLEPFQQRIKGATVTTGI
jgi:hypothetical protein